MTAPTPIQRWHLDIVRHWMVTEPDGQYVLYDDHLAAMAAAVPRWVPVSERIPDEGVPVLAYIWDRIERAVLEGGTWCSGNNEWMTECATHWMPLPPPSKEATL